jgi:hypothetical protein
MPKKSSLILFLIFSLHAAALPDDMAGIIDLADEWLVYENGDFVPYQSGSKTTTIYFFLNSQSAEDTLVIASPVPFSVYLNHQLIFNSDKELAIPVASLTEQYTSPWLVGIYQQGGIDRLSTHLSSNRTGAQNTSELKERAPNFFMDFCIVGTIFLLICLIMLMYTNAHLTFDYFNFLKLFSIQEREDSLLNSRISASTNILFYAFAALLGAFVLLIIFHNANFELRIAQYFQVRGFGHGLMQWLVLGGIIFALLILKLIVVAFTTSLFSWRDQAPIHYFNFIRLTFFIFSMNALLCLIFFVLGVEHAGAYAFLANVIVFWLAVWIIVIGLKLLRRVSLSFFHLFSYLCASELIPVVITIKVLLS